ncbi:glycerophosphodiester phosphodiesterase family protein [Mesoaciditoga lauensis]|uniref:glycerophosphodiester phosphodiesterase family protein n=1 Tax=Mesoaciditoga lauensis TaxID=1495039 RepID=UPI00055B63CA|nr:glycerophosphodiester phosphodiesterase family protein [Mesoaciditoga lauensis]
MKSKILVGIFSLIVVFVAFSMTPQDVGWKFDVEGHRGCRGLRPENTLAAFQFALDEVGVTTLELDLGVTKDNVLVISHDRALNPKKVRLNGKFIDSPILIHSLTLKELEKYTIGLMRSDYYWPYQVPVPDEKIPTFESVLKLVKDRERVSGRKIFINAEIKISPSHPDDTVDEKTFVNLVVSLLKKYDMEDEVMIQSFDWEALKLIKKADPKITTVALTREYLLTSPKWTADLNWWKFGGNVVKMVKAIGVDAASPYYKECDEELVKRYHANGIKVVPWTIDDPEMMVKYIDIGVDGIITDYPNVLRAVLIAKGIKVPSPINPK